MDPVSIVGLVGTAVSLIQTSASIVQSLHDLREKYKSTSSTLQNMTQECTILGATVTQIKIWIDENLSQAPEGQRQRILPLNNALVEFTIFLNPLHEEITSMLGRAGPSGILPRRIMFKAVWNDTKMKDHLNDIRWHANAIHQLLVVVQLPSKESSRRIQGIAKAASQYRDGSLYVDSGSTIDGAEFDFDGLLINTAAYRRAFQSQVRRANVIDPQGSTESSTVMPHRPGPSTPAVAEKPSHNLGQHQTSTSSPESNAPREIERSRTTQSINYPDAVPAPPAFRAKNDLNEATMGPLHIACWDGNVAMVEKLLETGVHPSVKTASLGWTPLHYAVRRKCYKIVDLLLRHGAKNIGDVHGVTPLHFAAEVCSRHHFLSISNNLGWDDLDETVDRMNRNLLHHAAFSGNIQVIKLLARSGALGNRADNDGLLPLHFACANGHLKAVQVLAQYYEGHSDNDLFWGMKFFDITISCHRWDIVSFLSAQWASMPGYQSWGQWLLYKGIVAGSIDLLNLVPIDSISLNDHVFEEHRPDMLCPYTIPLMLACGVTYSDVKVQAAIVDWLLVHGADPGYSSHFSTTPMHQLARTNAVPAASLLRHYGSHLEYEDYEGDTPLHIATRYGAIKMVRFLLENGVSPEPRNKAGQTPATILVNALDEDWKPLPLNMEKTVRNMIDKHLWLRRQKHPLQSGFQRT